MLELEKGSFLGGFPLHIGHDLRKEAVSGGEFFPRGFLSLSLTLTLTLTMAFVYVLVLCPCGFLGFGKTGLVFICLRS